MSDAAAAVRAEGGSSAIAGGWAAQRPLETRARRRGEGKEWTVCEVHESHHATKLADDDEGEEEEHLQAPNEEIAHHCRCLRRASSLTIGQNQTGCTSK